MKKIDISADRLMSRAGRQPVEILLNSLYLLRLLNDLRPARRIDF
jgi:hypothetical protein